MSTDDHRFEDYWRRLFEYRARVLDDDAGIAGWSAGGLAARYRQFVRAWQAEHGAGPLQGHWLDVGCGAGTYTRFLVAQQLQVTALDYSELTTRKARTRSPAGVRWAVADATRLPFATGSVDGALCFGVMQALSSPQRALAELHRVLKPGGELWVDALNGNCLPNTVSAGWRRARGKHRHLRYDTVGAFRRALEDSGFGAIRMRWLPVVPEPLGALQSALESRPMQSLFRIPPLGVLASHSFLAVARARAAAP